MAPAESAPPHDAARLIARAFAVGHISTALDALAKAFPPLLLRYADERLGA